MWLKCYLDISCCYLLKLKSYQNLFPPYFTIRKASLWKDRHIDIIQHNQGCYLSLIFKFILVFKMFN